MGLSTNQKVPTGRKLSHLGLDHSPLALWTGDGALTDSSGNGFDLGVDRGTELYGPLGGGLTGIFFNGVTRLGIVEAALKLSGDMTLQCLVLPTALGTTSYAQLIRAESPNNYIVYLYRDANADITVNYFQSNTPSGNFDHSPADYRVYQPSGPILLGMTRIGTALQFYVDGQAFGGAGTITGTVDPGTGGVLYLGETSANTQSFTGVMGSVKICDSGLTATQMYSEAERVGVV